MNLRDTKELLARIAAVDNRDLSEATAQAWHEVIGHLSFPVAERALTLARQDPKVDYLQPKHIIEKTRDAINELNQVQRALEEPDESKWQACDKPINFDEVVEFWKQVYQHQPWDRYTKTGAVTAGTNHSKGAPIEINVSAQELDRRARQSAAKLGWDVPEMRWS